MTTIESYKLCLNAHQLADSTRKTYMSEFKAYCLFFQGCDIRYISREQIMKYLSHLYHNGYSPSKVNQAINAIKFYKERLRGEKRETFFVKRPRREQYIPVVLSPEKVRDICMNTVNLKHRCILFVLYDNGLRISELINLTVMDVHSKCEDPQLIIRKSKHRKSRIVNLTDECVDLVREYYIKYRPKHFLFEGEGGNCRYSKTSIRRILDAACKREGVKQHMRVHDLRHNFATHVLIEGTNMKHLAEQLGHASVTTTEKYYTHLLPEQRKILRPGRNKEVKLKIAI